MFGGVDAVDIVICCGVSCLNASQALAGAFCTHVHKHIHASASTSIFTNTFTSTFITMLSFSGVFASSRRDKTPQHALCPCDEQLARVMKEKTMANFEGATRGQIAEGVSRGVQGCCCWLAAAGCC